MFQMTEKKDKTEQDKAKTYELLGPIARIFFCDPKNCLKYALKCHLFVSCHGRVTESMLEIGVLGLKVFPS